MAGVTGIACFVVYSGIWCKDGPVCFVVYGIVCFVVCGLWFVCVCVCVNGLACFVYSELLMVCVRMD